ncbi:MAG: hypothetical protein IPN76_06610 [Saprospiraceae bacterium]|nr:hypothetical protein [Saprospiraceae bacterium]
MYRRKSFERLEAHLAKPQATVITGCLEAFHVVGRYPPATEFSNFTWGGNLF